MEVHLTPGQEAFIERRVLEGRFATANEALREAVSLLEEREGGPRRGRAEDRKSLAQLFAESPFKGMDIEFPRDDSSMRSIEL